MLKLKHKQSSLNTQKSSQLKTIFLAGLIGVLSLTSCDTDKGWESQKTKELKELVLSNQRDSLKKQIIELGPDSIQAILTHSSKIPVGEEGRLDATALQIIWDVYKDDIDKWNKDSRIYIVQNDLTSLEDLDLTNDDMPQRDFCDEARYSDEDMPLKPLEIKEDMPLYKKMLILCDNDNEKSAFKAKVKEYKYSKIDSNPLKYSSPNGIVITVLTKDEISKTNERYGIIQFKGHLGSLDMVDLVKNNIVEGTTIGIMGGCGSYSRTKDYLNAGLIPFVNKGIGESAHNDYVSLQLVSQIQKEQSLKGAVDKLIANSNKTMNKYYTPYDKFTQRINDNR